MGARSPVPRPLGRALEPLYAGVVAARNRSFDRGRRVVDPGVPVVSVGNLSVGGTGKTPVVMAIVRWLLEAGRRPCVAMRGYGPRIDGISDEQAEYMERFGDDAPVVAQPDRVAGLAELRARRPEIDCAVLDDGFQHRFVARRLDVVVADATRSPFDDRLLPAGWLREPPASLARAHALVVTHARAAGEPAASALEARARAVNGGLTVARGEHAWARLAVSGPAGAAERREAPSWLGGKRVAVACAIGSPDGLLRAVRALGPSEVVETLRRDHHLWTPEDAAEIGGARADVVLTTAKDWSKLRRALPADWPTPVARPELEIEWTAGAEALERLVLDAAAPVGPAVVG